MGRNYQRKTPKRDENNLRRAVAAMQRGLSIRAVSRDFGIPRTTLFLHKRNNETVLPTPTPPEIDLDGLLIVHHGRETLLTKEQENALKEYMQNFSVFNFGLTSMQARILAFEFAKQVKAKVPQRWNVEMIAGVEWFRAFRRRHPELVLRKPEGNQLARSSALNRANVEAFLANFNTKATEMCITSDEGAGDPLAENHNEKRKSTPTTTNEIFIKTEIDTEDSVTEDRKLPVQVSETSNDDVSYNEMKPAATMSNLFDYEQKLIPERPSNSTTTPIKMEDYQQTTQRTTNEVFIKTEIDTEDSVTEDKKGFIQDAATSNDNIPARHSLSTELQFRNYCHSNNDSVPTTITKTDDCKVLNDYITTTFRLLRSEESKTLLRQKIECAIREVSEMDSLQ